MLPAFTGLGVAVLTIAPSASAVTGVCTVNVLFAMFGSFSLPAIVAVFVIVPLAEELTVTITVVVAMADAGHIAQGDGEDAVGEARRALAGGGGNVCDDRTARGR